MRRRLLVVVAAMAAATPVLILRGQDQSEMPHGDLKTDCSECHDPASWVPVVKTPTFRHETTGFPLQQAHARASCRSCHRTLVFTHVGTACADCHRDAHRGELGARCEACHTPTTWSNQRDMFRVHDRSRFPLFVAHARLDCTACHRNQRPYQYATTPAECGACHLETWQQTANPPHAASGFSTRCQDCHRITSPTWQGATFSHPGSFPLIGGHAGHACASCHTSGTYAGLATACVSCHQRDYAATTSPNHVSSRFPTTCEACHTIQAWRPATFDHGRTGFPLTGAHVRAECVVCHPGGRYAGTPKDCYSCHRDDYQGTSDPNHAASHFPTQCQNCHNTGAWRPASFDHGSTRFPLTGAHTRVDCARCHVGGRYAGTPTDCYSCHQANYNGTTDPNHQAAGFPTTCQNCHSTTAWRPATFDHDGRYFPIYSGSHRGRWSSCSDCHKTAGNFAAFECIYCHPHSNRTKTDSDHEDVSGYSYASAACYRCHPTGREDLRLRGLRKKP